MKRAMVHLEKGGSGVIWANRLSMMGRARARFAVPIKGKMTEARAARLAASILAGLGLDGAALDIGASSEWQPVANRRGVALGLALHHALAGYRNDGRLL